MRLAACQKRWPFPFVCYRVRRPKKFIKWRFCFETRSPLLLNGLHRSGQPLACYRIFRGSEFLCSSNSSYLSLQHALIGRNLKKAGLLKNISINHVDMRNNI
jgi:hypothetical protein